ncbi:hypothetical protein CRG98_006958 [Punica granatum]|uniref:Uncharacterized protein n=1 Tax=Punica granatum TaxID=22663 RepID=A0A2I0KVU6_PUNGR|nr:hypothetical protein CRG98_006958 [Punica granatum]
MEGLGAPPPIARTLSKDLQEELQEQIEEEVEKAMGGSREKPSHYCDDAAMATPLSKDIPVSRILKRVPLIPGNTDRAMMLYRYKHFIIKSCAMRGDGGPQSIRDVAMVTSLQVLASTRSSTTSSTCVLRFFGRWRRAQCQTPSSWEVLHTRRKHEKHWEQGGRGSKMLVGTTVKPRKACGHGRSLYA